MNKHLSININLLKLIVFIFISVIILGISTTNTTQAQPADLTGNRFFTSTITTHDENVIQEVIFYDTEGSLVVQGSPLFDVIYHAYRDEFNRSQLVDGSDWIYSSHLYDINAVPPPSFIQSDNEQMLKTLLADRFGLKIFRTSREMSVLSLELLENKLILEFISDETEKGIKRRMYATDSGIKNIRMEFTLDTFSELLSEEMNQNVINATELIGTYEIELNDIKSMGFYMDFEPLLERMGLKLVPQTKLIDVLVISNIEHPQLDN
mgnify:CR=1 FL=1|jgi:uncharacterized protein (TIGR03435 family)